MLFLREKSISSESSDMRNSVIKRRSLTSNTLSAAICRRDWSLVIRQATNSKWKAEIWANSVPGKLAADNLFLYELRKHVFGLPIHEAIYLGAPFEVIHALALAYPEGLTKRETVMNRLPLHLATMHKTMNESVVYMLMKYCRDAIAEVDNDCMTPLHYALQNPTGGSDRIIMEMLRFKSNVSHAIDKTRYTPLHLACLCGYSTKVIHCLLQLNPDSSFLRTGRGESAAQLFLESEKKKQSEEETHYVLSLLDHYKAEAEEQFRDALEVSSRRYVV